MSVCLLCVTAAWGVAPQARTRSGPTPVVIGESVTVQSRVLNEARQVMVSKPAAYEKSRGRYPVLYLLDAETHFHYASGIARFLASNDRMPDLIVVAIASGTYAQRTRDLTPPSSSEVDNRFSPGGGGAGAFLDFLATELIPYVEKAYRTHPYRLLAGHSFGGLFALYALSNQPRLFNAYLAIDPTLGWDAGSAVPKLQALLASSRHLQADLYLSASNTGRSADLVRLTAVLENSAPAALRWSFEWLSEETHGSVPLRSIHHGLDWVFDRWHLTDPLALFDKGGIKALHEHFREGGRRCGYLRTTPPFTVSLVVAGLIAAGRLEEASGVLLHDPKSYPPPWNQLDALARAFERRNDIEEAVRHYGMSLKANPRNERARLRLKELHPARQP